MPNLQTASKKGWYLDLILLTLGISLLFGLLLGTRPLSVPDEARYAEIPREMLVLHDFVTPHLNGVKYFEKPPLFYWLQAGSIKLFNPTITTSTMLSRPKLPLDFENACIKGAMKNKISEWVVRLPNASVALLGCLLLYVAGRWLFDRRTALLSAIILASSLLYFALARMVTLDMTLSVCLSGSLLFFLMAVNNPPNQQRRFLFYGAYGFAALAVLTKGLIGLLFPTMIIGSWILLTNQWRLLREMVLPSGILLFLVIVLPWHILVQLKNPEFFQFYFIEQQFLRYSTLIAQRFQSNWFFIPIVMQGFLPWICFLGQAIITQCPRNREQLKKGNKHVFLLLWIGLIFLFFSFSHSKLIPYILPIFPALALLTGHYFSTHWRSPTLKWGYLAVPCAWIVLGMIGFLWLKMNQSLYLVESVTSLLLSGYVVFLLGGIVASLCALQRKSNYAFGFLVIGSVISFLIFSSSIPKLDTRSIKPLAIVLNTLLQPGDKVVAYHEYYQDLPFYLNQRVLTVDVGGELTFGMQHQATRAWMLQDASFWPLWNSAQHVYVITNSIFEKEFGRSKNRFYLLVKTPRAILISNHPLQKNATIKQCF